MTPCDSAHGPRFLAAQLTAEEESAFLRHLDQCDACRSGLETAAAAPEEWETARWVLRHSRGAVLGEPAAPEAEAGADALALLAPTDDPEMLGRIGGYEVRGVVGRGGMGIVLKGYDRALHRNVAIKALAPHLAALGALRQRFANEARAMAAVSHENVVPVYAVDEQAGVPYFVMEYVGGGSLEARLQRQGPLATLEIVRVALQMARALEAAHRQGLVHRDIKPANVLLDAGTERVRVADFGLARVSSEASLTRSGVIAGTPLYMSPEQVRGEACDTRSDLFSLGSVLYALCVGHPPFRGENVFGVMQRILHDEPRSLRSQNPLVPEWLEGLVGRLLAKSPDDRFASAGELAAILESELAFLQNPGESPRPQRAWLRSSAWKAPLGRWLPRAAWVGVAAAAAVAAVSYVGPLGDARERDPRARAAAPATPSDVPLWEVDGTAAARARAAELDARWTAPHANAPDAWDAARREAEQAATRLLELSYGSEAF